MNNQPIGDKLILPDGSIAPISKAFKSNDFLFLSGQLAFESDGSLNTSEIESQTELCLNNIEAILSGEGLSRNNLVKLTIWLTDINDFKKFNDTYQIFFGNHRPARSTIRADLMLQGARIEIEAIASY